MTSVLPLQADAPSAAAASSAVAPALLQVPLRPCALVGHIVVIKKGGSDGPRFPIKQRTTLIGRHMSCDIRIQLPHVSKQHARIDVDENSSVTIENLSASGATLVNQKVVTGTAQVMKQGDVFTIGDRAFRIEYLSAAAAAPLAAKAPSVVVQPTAVAVPSVSSSSTPLKNSAATNVPVQPTITTTTPKAKTPRRASVAKTPVAAAAAPAPVATPVKNVVATAVSAAAVPIPSSAPSTPASSTAVPSTTVAAPAAIAAAADVKINFEASAAAAVVASSSSQMLESVAEGEESQFLSPMPAALPVSTPVAIVPVPLAANLNPTLPTPLRHSIQSAAVGPTLKPKLGHLNKMATPVKSAIRQSAAQLAQTRAQQAAAVKLSTPMKKGIQSGRLALKAVPAAPIAAEAAEEQKQEEEEAVIEQPAVEEIPAAVAAEEEVAPEIVSRVLPTPVRKSINSRRKSSIAPVVAAAAIIEAEAPVAEEPIASVAAEIEEAVAAAPVQRTLPTPLRKGIQSRRRASMAVVPVPATVEEVEQIVAPAAEEQVEAVVEDAEEAAVPASSTPVAARRSSRRVLPTPVRAAIVSKAATVAPKPALLSMPTPIKRALRGGRANLKSVPAAAAAAAAIAEEAEAEQDAPVAMEIDQAADAEEEDSAVPVREPTMHLSSELMHEEAEPIPAAAAAEEEVEEEEEAAMQREQTVHLSRELVQEQAAGIAARRRAMATPLKASIVAKAGELVQPKPAPVKVLSTPLKAAIRQVQPAAKPVMQVMPTPMRKALRGGRAELKPYFAPVVVEEGVSSLPVDAASAVLHAVPSTEAASTRRASMRLAPSAADASFAAVQLEAPLKDSLAAGAQEAASKRAAKAAPRKVLATPLKKGIRSRPELAHVEPVARPVIAEEEEEAQEEIDIPASALALPTPVRKGIHARRRSSVLPAMQMESVEEDEQGIDAAFSDEEQEEEIEEFDAAAEEQEVAVAASPAPAARRSSRRVLPTPVRTAIASKVAQAAPKPTLLSMPTPMKRALRGGRANLKAVPAVAPAPVEEEEEEVAEEAAEEIEQPAAAEEQPVALSFESEEEAASVADDEDGIAILQREPTMRLSIGFSREAEETIPAAQPRGHSRRAMDTPLKASIVTKAGELVQQKPAPLKVLSTPLKAAIRQVQPAAKPVMQVMPTPMRKALRGGRAQLKAVPAPVELVGEEEVQDEESSESEEEEAEEFVAAPAAPVVAAAASASPVAIVARKPVRLAPVNRRLAARRAGAHQRMQKHISHKRTTASTAAAQQARMAAKASLPRSVVAAAEISTTILEGLDELLNAHDAETGAAAAAPLEPAAREAIQPIFEALLGMKHDAMLLAAQGGPLTPLDVARGCHSSVATPVTPGRRASMTPSARRRWSFLSSAAGSPAAAVALSSSTPLALRTPGSIAVAATPQQQQAAFSMPSPYSGLVTGLVNLLSPSPARQMLSRSTRNSIDSIFAALVDVEMSLDEATEEDLEAERERCARMSIREDAAGEEEDEEKEHEQQEAVDEIRTPAKQPQSTPAKQQTPAPRRALATPLRASIVSKASTFVRATLQRAVDTPLRKSIQSRQMAMEQAREASKATLAAAKKMLATPLRAQIRQGVALKPVPVAAAAAAEPEAVVEAESNEPVVGLSLIHGLEALEAAMHTAANLEAQAAEQAAAVQPISFSLHAQSPARSARKSIASSRRQSRKSIAPASIAEELEEIIVPAAAAESAVAADDEEAEAEAALVAEAQLDSDRKEAASVVELLQDAIVAGIENMLAAQVAVEQVEAEAVAAIEAEAQQTEEVAVAEAPIEAEIEVAAPVVSKKKAAAKGSKRGRAAAAAKEAVVAEEEQKAPSPKKQRVEQPVAIVVAEPEIAQAAAAPVKASKRARTNKAAAVEEPVAVVLPIEPVVVEEPIAVAVAAPAKTRRGAASKRKAEAAPIEEPVEPVAAPVAAPVEEVAAVEIPAPKATRGGRGKKAAAAAAPAPEVAAAPAVEAAPIAEIPAAVEVEVAAPAKRGRGKKAAAVVVAEPEVVVVVPEAVVTAPAASVEEVIVAAPVRGGRKRKGATAAAADVEVAPVEVVAPVAVAAPVAEIEAVAAPAAKRARGGRKPAAAEVVAEESAPVAVAPVVAEPEVEAAAAAPVKARRGRKAAAAEEPAAAPVAAEPVVVEEEAAPVAKKTTRGKRAAAAAVEEVVAEPVVAPTRSTRARK